jgi:hypothetical protein
VVFTPFATGVGGTISGKWDSPEGNATTLAAQLPNILSGHSYINFHTTQFGGGEIRGAIAAVPEPSTILLFAIGTLTLGLRRWWSQAGTREAARRLPSERCGPRFEPATLGFALVLKGTAYGF